MDSPEAGAGGGHGRGRAEELSVNRIFRQYGEAYAASHRLTIEQRRVMRNLIDCRTVALGGHIDQCDRCGAVHYFAHSCRDRHCPQCQGLASAEWLAARAGELLPIPYFHTVFTVDHTWNPLLLVNQKLCYDLLFATANEVLKEFGQRYLDGEVGYVAVLHTWGQQLSYHVHLHCIVMGGALRGDGVFVTSRDEFLFPVVALSAAFRRRWCAGLVKLFESGKLRLAGECADWLESGRFAAQVAESLGKAWEVYIKPPFGQPQTVLEYLSGYVNRIALSNRRIVEVADGRVTFSYRDYRDGSRRKLLTLAVEEFMRRFLLHVLPAGFVRIRYYGLWHPGQRVKLAACRRQLAAQRPPLGSDPARLALWLRPLPDPTLCPTCGVGKLVRMGEFEGSRRQLPHRRRGRPLLASERRGALWALLHCGVAPGAR